MQAVARAVAQLPAEKLALGIPFYARHMQTGEWKTYTELLRSHGDTLSARTDEVKPSVICLVSNSDEKGLARGDRERPLNETQRPQSRVALGAGYNCVRGIGRW